MRKHLVSNELPRRTAFVIILPYIEQKNLEGKYDYVGIGVSVGWNEWIIENVAPGASYNPWFQQRLGFYQCPSDNRLPQYPNMRDYYGVVGGGPKGGPVEPVTTNNRGHTFDNGLFVQNRWRKFRDIADGSSNTFAIGESVHTSNWCSAITAAGGQCPGYGIPAIAGPDSWLGTDSCDGPNCAPSGPDYSVGRSHRSTMYPINYVLDWTKFSGCSGYSSCPENDPPFASFHSGGTHFVFIDGHVTFINDTINFATYQALGTIAGGEMIPGNAY